MVFLSPNSSQILTTFLPIQLHVFSKTLSKQTNKNTKIKTRQKIPKKATKYHGACLILTYIILTPCHGTTATSLLKTDFPFSSRYQLQISSWLGMRFCIHVISQYWKSIYTESV